MLVDKTDRLSTVGVQQLQFWTFCIRVTFSTRHLTPLITHLSLGPTVQAELRRFADFNGLSEEEIEARCAGLHAKVVALTLIRNAAERSCGEIM